MRKVLAGVASVLMLTSPAWAGCLPADAPVSGELRIVETRHPAGQLIRDPVLFVAEGQCVSANGVEGDSEGRLLRDAHLAFPSDYSADLDGLLGERVTATGEMSVSYTAWHLGSVVMFDARIIERTQ
jgi:hypothetical protein